MVHEKKILITGSNGMLGKDLVPLLKKNSYYVIETDIHNMDITNKTEVEKSITSEKPDFIIHAAAYTNVDGAETEQEKAFLINGAGSFNVAKISGELKIPIIYISTDYVFDGTKNSPYITSDAVNPINIYGASKLEGEKAVQEKNFQHYILRTSWLYGRHGKNFVDTMINLSSKNDFFRVVNDQIGCPTWTVELSKAILNFLDRNKPHGIYHICGSGSTTWWGFAKKIMEIMEINIEVKPVLTSEFSCTAQRPAYSVMDNSGICPHWEQSLKVYLKG